MTYYGQPSMPGPQPLGWLSVVISGVTLAYNWWDSSRKSEAEKFEAGKAVRTAEYEAGQAAAARTEQERQQAVVQETIKKSLPIIAVVAGASVLGMMMGKR